MLNGLQFIQAKHKFSNLTIQWGNLGWSGTEKIGNFNVAFPNYAVVTAWDGGSAIANYSCTFYNNSQFKILSNNGNWGATWLAVGY